jgi:hypothetical protein
MAERIVIGEFKTEQELLHAVKSARTAGHALFDVFSPYPVHGIEHAMGLPPSSLPQACLAFAITGLVGALTFEHWVFLLDWPMNIGGKSPAATPALIPVAFELTVLFAGIGSVAWLFWRRGLHPLATPPAAGSRALDDRFALALTAGPREADLGRLRDFLASQSAESVREEIL